MTGTRRRSCARSPYERTVRSAIAYLRDRGAARIVLVGLSAGGIGASRLAPRLAGSIDRLVLLSGVSSSAPTPPVPTLVLHGDDDRMVPTARVRRWATGRARVRFVIVPGTHFVLLEERAAIARAARLRDRRRRSDLDALTSP